MRNATAYGVSPRLRLDVVLNDLVAAAVTTGRIFIKSDGTPWRPIVHVRDIMAAIAAVLAAPKELVHNQVFNVGSNAENYRISELAEIVKEVAPGSRIEYDPNGGSDKRCYRVSCDKIERMLGFKSQWTACKGAQELYDTFCKVGLTVEQRGRYLRIATIERLLTDGKLTFSCIGQRRVPRARLKHTHLGTDLNRFKQHGLKPTIAQAKIAYTDALPIPARGRDQASLPFGAIRAQTCLN